MIQNPENWELVSTVSAVATIFQRFKCCSIFFLKLLHFIRRIVALKPDLPPCRGKRTNLPTAARHAAPTGRGAGWWPGKVVNLGGLSFAWYFAGFYVELQLLLLAVSSFSKTVFDDLNVHYQNCFLDRVDKCLGSFVSIIGVWLFYPLSCQMQSHQYSITMENLYSSHSLNHLLPLLKRSDESTLRSSLPLCSEWGPFIWFYDEYLAVSKTGAPPSLARVPIMRRLHWPKLAKRVWWWFLSQLVLRLKTVLLKIIDYKNILHRWPNGMSCVSSCHLAGDMPRASLLSLPTTGAAAVPAEGSWMAKHFLPLIPLELTILIPPRPWNSCIDSNSGMVFKYKWSSNWSSVAE